MSNVIVRINDRVTSKAFFYGMWFICATFGIYQLITINVLGTPDPKPYIFKKNQGMRLSKQLQYIIHHTINIYVTYHSQKILVASKK